MAIVEPQVPYLGDYMPGVGYIYCAGVFNITLLAWLSEKPDTHIMRNMQCAGCTDV